MSKYILKKDLPFAKAGAEEVFVDDNSIYIELGNGIIRCLDPFERFNGNNISKELERLISEGWIEEVKPREWDVAEYNGEIISNGGFVGVDQSKVNFFKVREVIE